MRARINERLRSAARFPVTLIVAPAGFGKSIALRDFIESERLDVVRYDVHREDSTLLAFVRRISETLEPVAPGPLASFPGMQERVLASEEPVRQISDWFAEHLKDARCTIVIDDLHFAAVDPASIALLADLIERTGERITWIIAARTDVGLPVATWVAYRRMDLPIGEDDLRFTTDEAMAAAVQSGVKLDLQEIEALRQLTEGWPVAMTIAMRTRTHSGDLRTAAFSTREMIYRFLAEQVFATLTLPQRAFALASSVFSTFDRGVAEALGATPAFLEELRAKTTFLHEVAPGEYRYHDLFRDFLEAELRHSGENEWLRAHREGARLHELRGDAAGALVLYTKARATEEIVAIVERAGFSLFERGEVEKLVQALEVVPDSQRRSSAMLAGLRAMIDASRGRFEIAETAFLAAINLAQGDDLRLPLVHRYALELVRQDRDCVGFLEPYTREGTADPGYRAPLLATLATGFLRAGRDRDALDAIDQALKLQDASLPEESRARLYQQASYVERYAGSLEKARAYALSAIDFAFAHNLYELAARAYSVLYTIARDTADDPIEALQILERLDESARKGASAHATLFALVARYEIEVELANDAALEAFDVEMQSSETMLPQLRRSTVVAMDALRAAWEGDFERAYALVAETVPEQSTLEQRALRAADAALYATAAGMQREADAHLDAAGMTLASTRATNRHVVRARLTMALASLLRGHEVSAHRLLTEAERSVTGGMRRMRAFAHAVRVVYRTHLGQASDDEFPAALERLRAEHFGGIARLLEALPMAGAHGAYAALTPSEREVLQLLAKGASTKEVAARTGRSPHTVDTHIRSICRKLELPRAP